MTNSDIKLELTDQMIKKKLSLWDQKMTID